MKEEEFINTSKIEEKEVCNLNWPQIILFAIFFSSFSSFLFQDFLHLPFMASEMIIIPLLISLKDILYFDRKLILKFVIIGLVLFSIGLISLITIKIQFNFLSIISSVRYYCFYALGFILFRHNTIFTYRNFVRCAFICLLFDLLADYYAVNILLVTEGDAYSGVTNIDFLMCSLLISFSFIHKSNLFTMLVIVLSIVVAFFSISRGLIMYIVSSIIASFVLSIFMKNNNSVVKISILVSLTMIGLLAYNFLDEIIKNASPYIYHRLYEKMDNFGSAEGDDLRLSYFPHIISDAQNSFIPHGFPIWNDVSRFKEINLTLYSIKDSSLTSLIYTFGFSFIFIVLYYIKHLFLLMKNFLLSREEEFYLVLPTFILLLLFVCFGYGMLCEVNKIFVVGMIFGYSARIVNEQ